MVTSKEKKSELKKVQDVEIERVKDLKAKDLERRWNRDKLSSTERSIMDAK